MKNIILESFKESWKSIKKHKFLIMLIFIIQIAFFFFSVLNIAVTMPPAIGAMKEVLTYVEQLKLDENALAENLLAQKPMLGDNPSLMYDNYRIITYALGMFLVIGLIIFFIFEGLNWVLTVHMHKKHNVKKFFIAILHFIILTILYFLIIGIILMNVLRSIVQTPTLDMASIILNSALILVLIYFMLISFSLIHNNNLIEIIKKTYLIGVFKAYLILPLNLFNLVLTGFAGYFLYLSAEANLFWIMVSSLFFTFCFIFNRILFVKLIHGIED